MKFDDLLKAARQADPGSRIEFRDRIAAKWHGGRRSDDGVALRPRTRGMRGRVLLRIADDPADRRAAVAALSRTDLTGVSTNVARDIRDALSLNSSGTGHASEPAVPVDETADTKVDSQGLRR